MCGIIWQKNLNNKSVKNAILKQFEKQRTRGVQGFGFILLDSGQAIQTWYQSQYEHEMRQQIKHATVPEILFHHRFPTSTPNLCEATHPILVDNASLQHRYYVVHNGIIGNAKTLHDKYVKDGFVFTTEIVTQYKAKRNGKIYNLSGEDKFNDSESLAIDLSLSIEKESTKLESTGSIAFIAIQVDKITNKALKLFFGRNFQNPLWINKSNNHVTLASEGDGEMVEAHKLHCYEYATGEIAIVRDFEIGIKYTPTSSVATSSGDDFWKKWGAGYRTNKEDEELDNHLHNGKKDIKQLALPKVYNGDADNEVDGIADDPEFEKEGTILVWKRNRNNNVWYCAHYETFQDFQDSYFELQDEIADLETTQAAAQSDAEYAFIEEELVMLQNELEDYERVYDGQGIIEDIRG